MKKEEKKEDTVVFL